MVKVKTKLEVIEETVTYYSENVYRRSVDSKQSLNCLYNGPGGRQCAFARCANSIPITMEGKGADTVLSTYPDILKDEYKINDPIFWLDIQMLHDQDRYWNSQGLSESGVEIVKELKIRYK